MSNILQVKERGATTIVITNLANIDVLIDLEKIDHLIELTTVKSVLAAILACVPLQLICYLTALAKGINPDK